MAWDDLSLDEKVAAAEAAVRAAAAECERRGIPFRAFQAAVEAEGRAAIRLGVRVAPGPLIRRAFRRLAVGAN